MNSVSQATSFGSGVRSSHVALALAAAMIVLGVAGGDLTPLLEYERSRILAGEWWRVITSHFVHLGPLHLFGNVAAILAWGYFFDERENLPSVVLRLLIGATAIGAGVLIFSEQVTWMLGASGLVHALIAGSALRLVTENRRPLGALVLAVLLLKVAAEQGLGLTSWMESIADYQIVSVAHAYGVAAGLIFELARGYKLPPGITRGMAVTKGRTWRSH